MVTEDEFKAKISELNKKLINPKVSTLVKEITQVIVEELGEYYFDVGTNSEEFLKSYSKGIETDVGLREIQLEEIKKTDVDDLDVYLLEDVLLHKKLDLLCVKWILGETVL